MTLTEEIKELCREKDAVILAHYYVDSSIQAIADYVGDSFYLAKVAKSVPNKTIVFCGVTFMGESACILNPDKTVLMPSPDAVCPMALMIDKEKIAEMRSTYDDLAVVCYINSMADVKELSDVCVTSSNALKIVRNLPNHNIFFIPDGNLGRYVAEQIPEKNIILNPGFCHVHASITSQAIMNCFKEHPAAKIIAHPECRKDVCDLADYLGSTKELIEYVAEDDAQEYIVCTEKGVLYKMEQVAPEKKFYFVGASQICPNMKKMTLEKVRDCLVNMSPVAVVSEETRLGASVPLDRMLELASQNNVVPEMAL
ncbi:quinolinate synthase [Treponema rectale]|uniref:Quinolinate synthase n=1 Tax=Treponema rectale TaxID=744512 RepID=A0A840SAU9_9SPIR|nr:quinolinate synthase NadA [Treponema rectale]MBB5219839.1 quinolinate synthase [Treponema rectale]